MNKIPTLVFGLFHFFISFLAASQSTTTQKLLPLPFCQFENLYFDVKTRTFIAKGTGIIPEKALISNEQRGYSLKTSSELPEGKQVILNGTTLFLFESPITKQYRFHTHFFHILEHLVGFWSFYGSEHSSDVKLIVLASEGSDEIYSWEGPNKINMHVMKALFPQAKVMNWHSFINEYPDSLLKIEHVLTSDREITVNCPECSKINKMLGAALPSLSKEALNQLALKVNAYADEEKVVTYLKRPQPRTLAPHLEERLLKAISTLEGVHLTVADFAAISFKEQVRIIGKTDILISVHGNGLSHILYLPQSAAAVEIFPPDTLALDYRLFADARGIDYLGIISNKGVIPRKEAYEIGHIGNVQTTIHDMDIEPILSFIQNHIQKTD